MGATANSADNYVLPMLANALIGTRMQALTGYVGQNEIDLAVERGEVQGNNTGLSNLTAGRADWVRDNKVRILLQYGNERLASLKDVPTALPATSPCGRWCRSRSRSIATVCSSGRPRRPTGRRCRRTSNRSWIEPWTAPLLVNTVATMSSWCRCP
jgi:hypothetical protein